MTVPPGQPANPRQSPRVVHFSCDFPDPVDPGKTRVIRTLCDLIDPSFDQTVYSMNRESPGAGHLLLDVVKGWGRPRLSVATRPFDRGTCVTYRAPGRGVFHATMLRQLGEALARHIARADRPDLIVGHKLAVEGIAAMTAARRMGCGFAVTIQGDSDTKILAARPDLAPLYRQVFHEARLVVSFAPWSLKAIERRLGKRSGPTVVMPCPTGDDTVLAPRIGNARQLLSVFHLTSQRRKNLAGIGSALRILADQNVPVDLAIVGGGDDADLRRAKAIATGAPGLDLEGPLAPNAIRARMNQATGFVLPSHRETFGLVFVEALFAGLPVIYPEGQAIDGYFDGCPFTIPVKAGDPHQIARAMQRLVDEEASLKAALAEWQASEDRERFTREAIGRAYVSNLQKAASGSIS